MAGGVSISPYKAEVAWSIGRGLCVGHDQIILEHSEHSGIIERAGRGKIKLKASVFCVQTGS